jgi:GNAT superfamily N-acetyltransferase
MTNIRIERATLAQTSEIHTLIQLSMVKIYPKVYPSEAVDFFIEYHNLEHIEVNIKEGITLLAFDGNLAIGTINLKDNYLGGLYIHPHYLRQGLGRLLIQKAEAIAKTMNISKIKLEASLGSEEFYLSLGYQKLETKYTPLAHNARLYYFDFEKQI